ncbi:MAG: methyltransferase domain-containing protein [Pseudomonadota bacterium]
MEGISDRVVCAQCRAALDTSFHCAACGQVYPCLSSIRVLLPNPVAHREHWQRQLGFLVRQGDETPRALRQQAAQPGIGDATRTRLHALANAVAAQVADVSLVLGPLLGGPLPPTESTRLPRGAMDYITCLFRDWAWASGHDEENVRSLDAVRRVSEGRALGRTLVLGAGGCRLAYDLHLQCGGTQTAVLDVDPYLLGIAEAVVRGASVRLTESSVNAPEIEPVSCPWVLTAPSGPLGADAFQFFLANGTEPPFSEGSFDTVVTPWFIDQVPADLGGLMRKLHALLVPGGRWLNHGPLIYGSELPVAHWYTREEVFELARAVGFRVGAWEQTPLPHFASPWTGRGLIENVLTFEATRV